MLNRWLSLPLMLWLSTSVWADEPERLTMAFNQRAPYHYFVGNQPIPQGVISDQLVRVLYDANLRVDFVSMPGDRILAETKKNWPLCAFTWFKNPERSQFAKFSLPLWKDTPFVVVTHQRNERLFKRYDTLDKLLRHSSLALGGKLSNSYGPYIDQLLNRADNRMRFDQIASSQLTVIEQLDQGRFDAVLLTPEEAPGLFRSARVDFSQYISIDYRDIPEGATRHIMCSKSVSDHTLLRLNRSIRRLIPAYSQR